MKKVILIIVAIISVVSVSNAQVKKPTGARPAQQSAAGHAISTLGQFTQESVEVKSDGKGSLDMWRLTGVGITAGVGYGKDGLGFSVGGQYQLRIPKAPWTRCFIFGASVGSRQLEIDGETKQSINGDLYAALDIMTLVAPKSRFVLNVGAGANWHHVKYDATVMSSDNEYGFKHSYKATSWGPKVFAQVGYDFDRRFSVLGQVSYESFSVERQPMPTYKYDGVTAELKLVVKLGRK